MTYAHNRLSNNLRSVIAADSLTQVYPYTVLLIKQIWLVFLPLSAWWNSK